MTISPEQISASLIKIGIPPTLDLIAGIQKISRSYDRNKSNQVSKEANLQALEATKNNLLKGLPTLDSKGSLAVARMALHGFTRDSNKDEINQAYELASEELNNAIGRGRPSDIAKSSMLTSLCLLYAKTFKKMPPCRMSDEGMFAGKGLDYVVEFWRLITHEHPSAESVGRYIKAEKSRLHKEFGSKQNFLNAIAELNHP